MTHWFSTSSGRIVSSNAESPVAGRELLEAGGGLMLDVAAMLELTTELELIVELELITELELTSELELTAVGKLVVLDDTVCELTVTSLEILAELTSAELCRLLTAKLLIARLLTAVASELEDVPAPPVHALTTKAAALIAEIFLIIATALILACSKLPLHSWQSLNCIGCFRSYRQ